MYAGRIVESGRIEDIYEDTKHPYTKGLFSSLPSLSTKVKRLKPILGLMPDPANLPAGCPFHPRCDQVMPECSQTFPPETVLEKAGEEEHKVFCWRYVKGGR
jgi:peptide/nickel transport system ATP-binding protein